MSSFFDDLAPIFRDTFGEDVSYTKVGGQPIAITGIVLAPSILVDGLAEADIVVPDTELHCAVADLPDGYGEGDAVVARGAAYKVKGAPMPDGKGMVRLPLFKA